MAVFFGTFENKVDSKGRISVPAPFRQALAALPFQGIVAFRSYRVPAIEGCGMDFMEQLIASVSEIDLFSDEHDDLATTIFSDSLQLPFDGQGRIILPDAFCEHAGITDRAAFVGRGNMFQVWEPGRLEEHKSAARQRAKDNGLTVALRPRSGDRA